MEYISEALMDKTWQRVGAAEARQVTSMQKRHQKDQRPLAKFVYHRLLDLREDAAGVGVYAFHVVLEAFSGVLPKPKTVRPPHIDRVWQSMTSEVDEAAALEPHATRYLDDALNEADDVVLSDAERRHCARVVRVAILCLHEACGK